MGLSENNDWWTAPGESDDGRLVMVTGRRDIAQFRRNPRFSIRIEIRWVYDTASNAGMPSEADAATMGTATDNLLAVLAKDPAAVMTGIFTGAGERTWVFYTLSTHIFPEVSSTRPWRTCRYCRFEIHRGERSAVGGVRRDGRAGDSIRNAEFRLFCISRIYGQPIPHLQISLTTD